jgi:hypothetical protein
MIDLKILFTYLLENKQLGRFLSVGVGVWLLRERWRLFPNMFHGALDRLLYTIVGYKLVLFLH